MELIADALLIAGALGAAFYCRTLARRLGALKDLDSGLGAAIAALSRQVDEMRASLDAAKSVSGDQTREVAQLTARAEMAAGRLELLLASLHEGERRRPLSPEAREARAARRDRLGSSRLFEADGDSDDEPAATRPSPRPSAAPIDENVGVAQVVSGSGPAAVDPAEPRRREPILPARPAARDVDDARVTDEAVAMRLAAAAMVGERWRNLP